MVRGWQGAPSRRAPRGQWLRGQTGGYPPGMLWRRPLKILCPHLVQRGLFVLGGFGISHCPHDHNGDDAEAPRGNIFRRFSRKADEDEQCRHGCRQNGAQQLPFPKAQMELHGQDYKGQQEYKQGSHIGCPFREWITYGFVRYRSFAFMRSSSFFLAA